MKEKKRILCINADLQSTNLGCAALGLSFVQVLREIAEKDHFHIEMSVLGYGRGKEYEDKYISIHETVYFDLRNIKVWKYLKDNIAKADLIVDFTGGDSFTDIYGMRRFCRESIVKELAIQSKAYFVLGPQTIGPFNNSAAKKIAEHLLLKSDYVFARDEVSNNYARNLGCDSVLTTDVAFMLQPTTNNYSSLNESTKIKIGINVSGLMMNGGYNSNNQFGLKMDYKKFIDTLVSECLKANYEVYLVPHVLPLHSPAEDDYKALEQIHSVYPQTVLAPKFLSPKEAKEYISYMNFFVGSRMHATIGSFSVEVPTIPVAYSPKFSRLFSSVGYNRVIDGKVTNEADAVSTILDAIAHREEIKKEMQEPLNVIKSRNKDFVRKIRDILNNSAR